MLPLHWRVSRNVFLPRTAGKIGKMYRQNKFQSVQRIWRDIGQNKIASPKYLPHCNNALWSLKIIVSLSKNLQVVCHVFQINERTQKSSCEANLYTLSMYVLMTMLHVQIRDLRMHCHSCQQKTYS